MWNVRIATYNLHSCIGVDGRCAPERIAEVIAEMVPDVICLQELDVERSRTGAVDQAAEIARILTMQFHFHATIQEVSGRYGDAILSKTPLTVVRADHLPEVPRPFPREARGAIWIETKVEGRTWQIINTHFGLGHGERRLQARALVRDWITPALARPPLVVCGDFNSRPASVIHQIIRESLRDALAETGQPRPCTFATRWPFVCLDYLFVSPEIRVEHVKRSSRSAAVASDHFPIVAEVHGRRPPGFSVIPRENRQTVSGADTNPKGDPVNSPDSMKSFLKREYRKLKASPPGRRFQELHRRRVEKRKSRQPWLAIAGLPVLLFGIFLLFVPGPGVIFVVVGLALFAQESPFVARALDAAELRLLCWFYRKNGRA